MAALTMSDPPTSATSRAAYLRKSPPFWGRCWGATGAATASVCGGERMAAFARGLPWRRRSSSASIDTRRCAARDSMPAARGVVWVLDSGNVIPPPCERSGASAVGIRLVQPLPPTRSAVAQEQEGYYGPCIKHDRRFQGVLEAAALDFPNIGELERFGSQFLLDRQVLEVVRVLAGGEPAGICHIEEPLRVPAAGEPGGCHGHRLNCVAE